MALIEFEKHNGAVTMWGPGDREILRLVKPRTATLAPVTVLHAHRDGSPVSRVPERSRLARLSTVCGVVLASRRLGSLSFQWRRWAR